jgi:hypothetical protein
VKCKRTTRPGTSVVAAAAAAVVMIRSEWIDKERRQHFQRRTDGGVIHHGRRQRAPRRIFFLDAGLTVLARKSRESRTGTNYDGLQGSATENRE